MWLYLREMYRAITGTLVVGEKMPMLLHYPQKLLLLAKSSACFCLSYRFSCKSFLFACKICGCKCIMKMTQGGSKNCISVLLQVNSKIHWNLIISLRRCKHFLSEKNFCEKHTFCKQKQSFQGTQKFSSKCKSTEIFCGMQYFCESTEKVLWAIAKFLG